VIARTLADRETMLSEQKTIFDLLRGRCDAMHAALDALSAPALTPDPFNSGFFCLLNFDGPDCETVADHLLKKYRIGVIPIRSQQYGINAVRAAFCSVDKNRISDLVNGINAGIQDLK
jgi:aspartate/methionine/tyrosine aminotransferase